MRPLHRFRRPSQPVGRIKSQESPKQQDTRTKSQRFHIVASIILILIATRHAQAQLSALSETAAEPQQQQQQQPTTEYLQHNNNLHFFVPENVPNRTVVGTIRSAGDQVPYLVVPSKVNPTPEEERLEAFYVNLSTGELLTNGPLDRERRDQYHFVAIIERPFTEIQCVVTVKDVNDNAPMFLLPQPVVNQAGTGVATSGSGSTSSLSGSGSASQSNNQAEQMNASTNNNNIINMNNNNNNHYVIEVAEGQRGIRKMLPLAIDTDSPQFGIKEFRIVSGNTPSGTFVLVEHEAPLNSAALQSNLAAAAAADDQSAQLIGADNPQLMQQLAQQASVLIPSQPGTSSAAGSFVGAQPQLISTAPAPAMQTTNAAAIQIPHSRFQIDLEVSQPLDRENQSSYQFVVEAIDGGQPPLIGNLRVTVLVTDINDNDPVFAKKSYECHFKEDTPKGTLLLRVHATDADSDANAQISYFIKRHSTSSQLSSSSSSSSSNGSLAASNDAASNDLSGDRSSGASRLAAGPKQRASLQVAPASPPSGKTRLGGSDINQHNSDSAHNRLKFSATASHASAQSTDSSSLLFEIDPAKGELYLTHPLDYETDQMHELLIEARDHGKPARSAYASVKVFVLDVNDDPPPPALAARLPGGLEGLGGSVGAAAHLSGHMSSGGGGLVDDRKSVQAPLGLEMGRGAAGASGNNGDAFDQSPLVHYLSPVNVVSWLGQQNSLALFAIISAALSAVAFLYCFVKIKTSRAPESDYNDTAGLTGLSSSLNNTSGGGGAALPQQTKSTSPATVNYLTGGSNGTLEPSDICRGDVLGGGVPGAGSGPAELLHNHSLHRHHLLHHEHHMHHARSLISSRHHLNGSFAGLVSGAAMGACAAANSGFATSPGSSSARAAAAAKLRYATQYPHHAGEPASNLYHNPYQPAPAPPGSQSQHTTLQRGGGGGGGVGGSHQPHRPLQSASTTTATTTTPPPPASVNPHHTLHHSHGGGGPHAFDGSPDNCGVATSGGGDAATDIESAAVAAAASSQLIYAQDWYGSYNWDYLNDWTPDYHTIMPLIQSELAAGGSMCLRRASGKPAATQSQSSQPQSQSQSPHSQLPQTPQSQQQQQVILY